MPLLRIKKTVFGGDGLAELNGKAVFVEGALPGEAVEVEIIEDKKNYSRAKILKIVEASPHRLTPPCPHALHCGGCQYQHVSYEEELKLKNAQLQEIFSNSGFAALLQPIQASPKEWGYRSSLTLHPVQPNSKSSTRLGFVAKDNKTIIPVKNCLIADERFRPLFSKEIPAKKCPERVTFKLDESGQIVDDIRESFLKMRLNDESYLVHSAGFFQTNPAIASQIARRIVEEVKAYKPDVLFDLFSGVGTFGLACSAFCSSIVFVEESKVSVQALEMNVAERKLVNARVVQGRTETAFAAEWRVRGNERSLVIVDPPRAGLETGLARLLGGSPAGKLLYLSCDPVTLERDLSVLKAAGAWKVESLVPFDMFPKTKHLETLAVLSRMNS